MLNCEFWGFIIKLIWLWICSVSEQTFIIMEITKIDKSYNLLGCPYVMMNLNFLYQGLIENRLICYSSLSFVFTGNCPLVVQALELLGPNG